MSMPLNVDIRKMQAVLLATMLAIYFLWPGRVPLIQTSLHGALLAASLVIYLITERRLDWRLFGVYAPFVVAVTMAAFMASAPPGRDALRPVMFGLLSSYLFAYYTARTSVLDYVRRSVVPIVTAFAVCLTLLPFLPQFSAIDGVTAWLLSSIVERGLFFIFAAVFLFFVSLRSRLALLGAVPLFIAVFIAVMLTSLRGIWLAAAVAVFIFAVLHRRVLPSLVVAVTFAMAVVFAQRLPDIAAPPPGQDVSLGTAVGTGAAARAIEIRLSDLAVKSADRNKRAVDFSNAGRLGYWRAGINMWRDHPWFGVGLGRFSERSERYALVTEEVGDAETSFDPHNTFVSMLAETGVVGLGGFLMMVGIIVGKSALAWWRASDAARLRHAVVLALFLGVTAVGLTWDVHLYRLWWVSLGLALGSSQVEWRQSS